MANESNRLLVINGTVLPQPASYEWSLQDVSASSAGRTEDALMHKETVAKKRKLKVTWKAKNTTVTAQILQAVSYSEYFSVRYFDMLENQYSTRTFYVGDRSSGVKKWWVGDHLIDTISFDLIER